MEGSKEDSGSAVADGVEGYALHIIVSNLHFDNEVGGPVAAKPERGGGEEEEQREGCCGSQEDAVRAVH